MVINSFLKFDQNSKEIQHKDYVRGGSTNKKIFGCQLTDTPSQRRGLRYSDAGFTLTEILVIIAILALVIAAVYSGYSLSQRAYREGETAAEVTQNGRVILERIAREIRQAREIVTELSEEEIGAVSVIIFEDGHITESYNYIRYFGVDDDLRREVIGYYFSGDVEQMLVPWNAQPPEGQTLDTKIIEGARMVGEYVTDLKFWGTRVVNISLTLTKNNKQINLSTKIFGRNI